MWTQRSFRGSVAVGLVVGFLSAWALSSVTAQGPPSGGGNLSERVAALEALLADVTRNGNTLVFGTSSGMNIQVVNGQGSSEIADGGGLGNIIIGYNELYNDTNEPDCETQHGSGNCVKSGSHNLIVGLGHSYASWGGIATGRNQAIIGTGSAAVGSGRNTALGNFSALVGGGASRASGFGSTVVGGFLNEASGTGSVVSGGQENAASGFTSAVSGGIQNTATGPGSAVNGGGLNTASGTHSVVGGGLTNEAVGQNSVVAGGAGITTVNALAEFPDSHTP